MNIEQLQNFTFSNNVGRFGEHRHYRHRSYPHHHLEGAGIEEVADQHGGGIAEFGIGGIAAAPQTRFVDNIIVKQCRGVNEFDHRGYFVQIGFSCGEVIACQQYECRAQPFPAGFDDVLGNLIDQYDF